MAVTLGTEKGPTNRTKNCTTWGEYESAGTSEFAALCNGGNYRGEIWGLCPSRNDCRKSMWLNKGRTVTQSSNERYGSRHHLTTLPTTAPQRTQRPQVHSAGITRRENVESSHLSSLRVDHSNGSHGLQSPTHLPEEGENIFSRLGRNILQGAGTSTGWHVYDMGQNADFFPMHKPTKKKKTKSKKDKGELARLKAEIKARENDIAALDELLKESR